MSLLQENRKVESSSKKIYMICGIGIVLLIFIIVALLAVVSNINKNKAQLLIDGNNYSVNGFLINKDNTIYIGLENLTKAIASDGYTYRKGNRDIEDENQCYITDSAIQESVFFKVGTNEIYKSDDVTNEIVHYTLSKPVIKENEKIYIPIEDCKMALNMNYTKNKNQYSLSTIEYLEKYYNQQASNSFLPDTSIVWATLPANKKLLRDGLVIVADSSENLGIAFVSSSTDSKKKLTTVSTTQIITPKYKYIKYVEKYNQLIVETSSGRGVVELSKSSDGNYTVKTIISPQYEEIKQLDEERFIISQGGNKIDGKTEDEKNNKSIKYGIINKEGEEILPVEYQQIGIDAYEFTNNHIENKNKIFNSLIPVKKNDLWGFVNLKGQTIIGLEYTDLGCKESNSSSNVLIIPDKDLIVVKKDKNYGIISKTGKVYVKPVLTKVYQENEDGVDNYYMIYNDKKVNINEYFKSSSSKTQTLQVKNEEENTKTENTSSNGTTQNEKANSDESKETANTPTNSDSNQETIITVVN